MSTPTPHERDRLTRWRLVLGAEGESGLGCSLGPEAAMQERALAFLYDREYGRGRNVRRGGQRGAGLEDSQLTVPEWINLVHELFPQRVIERLEQDALERYHLEEMVTNPEVLARAQPSTTLLKAVLHTKHLMNQEVLAMARHLVKRVIDDLLAKLARPVESAFCGTINRLRHSTLRVAKNFDARTTVRRNLEHYDPGTARLFIRTPHFFSRVRRHTDRWQIIILVDESGSMANSVIHSAVTAAIFHGIRMLRTHLVLFDTSVVDVTSDCSDPVETIMKVQLGGGTDIGQALQYASTLVENPRRCIVVLITDFFEGAPAGPLAARHATDGGERRPPCWDSPP